MKNSIRIFKKVSAIVIATMAIMALFVTAGATHKPGITGLKADYHVDMKKESGYTTLVWHASKSLQNFDVTIGDVTWECAKVTRKGTKCTLRITENMLDILGGERAVNRFWAVTVKAKGNKVAKKGAKAKANVFVYAYNPGNCTIADDIYLTTSEVFEDGSWTVESDCFLDTMRGPEAHTARTQYEWYLNGKRVQKSKSPKGDFGDWIETRWVSGKSAKVKGTVSVVLKDGTTLPLGTYNFSVEPAAEDMGDEWYPIAGDGSWFA